MGVQDYIDNVRTVLQTLNNPLKKKQNMAVKDELEKTVLRRHRQRTSGPF